MFFVKIYLKFFIDFVILVEICFKFFRSSDKISFRFIDKVCVNLRFVDKVCVDLRFVDKVCVDLRFVDKVCVDLRFIDKVSVDLRFIDKVSVNLRSVDKVCADLEFFGKDGTEEEGQVQRVVPTVPGTRLRP